jgi:peroxiredoxin-like protein
MVTGRGGVVENQYEYRARAVWSSGREGQVGGEGVPQALDFSAPPEFQGKAGAWTPEHLLMAAVASCFITTFRAIAEYSHFEFSGLEVAAEGTLSKAEGGFRFTKIVVHPELTVRAEQDRERGLRLLDKAERACLISRSLNAEISLEPRVTAAALR